ncbi:MAG TPA: PqqD family protein [Anaerolineae bacterium]|nr:PqqD family protein [Anaerolineae bacterium]
METETYLDKRFAKDPSIVERKIGDEFILVPIRQRAGEVESIYTLNEVAARVWELLDGQRDVASIRDTVVEEFEVGPEEAEIDVVEFVRQLEHAGAVREG